MRHIWLTAWVVVALVVTNLITVAFIHSAIFLLKLCYVPESSALREIRTACEASSTASIG
jgi:hypothetical protein